MNRQFYVYIMANPRRVIYIGVTNKLELRVWQHKRRQTAGFTAKYKCRSLVYYEATESVRAAIEREKQLEGWLRAKKLTLITSANPTWRDLSADWPAPVDTPGAPADPSLRSG